MPRDILVLQGSPRSDGNSADLANMFTLGARDAGHTVHMPEVNGKNISGCIACDQCRKNGGFCFIHDYMYQIYEMMHHADAIVMISPVYFFGLPAQIKAILDRFYCYGPNWPKMEFALLLTSNSDDQSVFKPMIEFYNHLVEFMDWDARGLLMVGSLKSKGDIRNRAAYQEAYKLGQSM